MKLSGGNYGGYELMTNSIKLEDKTLIVTFVNDLEFYIIDDNGSKWYYNINLEEEKIIFSGVN